MADIVDVQWLVFGGLVAYLVYRYLTKNYNYWAQQNVPFVRPFVFLGSFNITKKPLHETEQERYQKYGRIYGRFDGSLPVLSIAEPDLLKKVLVKDFHIFPNHRDLRFNDPLVDNMLFILENDSWKRVRNIVSPAFTGSKLRKMLPLVRECCDVLVRNLEEAASKNENVDCQRIFGAFTMDTIGRCAFGMKINSLLTESDPFVSKANVLLKCLLSWRTLLTMLCPKLMKWLRICLLNPETTQFYRNIVNQLVEQRKEETEPRNDFLQLLLDAEEEKIDGNNNTSEITEGSSLAAPRSSNSDSDISPHFPLKGLSHDEFLAQCVSFFIAGYDSTTSLFSYAVYNLAIHEDCQQRLWEDITEVRAKNEGNLNYEALSEMKYMEAVISETLRLCPSIVRADRRAEFDYELGETGIKIRKGMLVSIPVYAIHRDPQWYPNPNSFCPERFLRPELVPPPYTHLPFGGGPRLCLGMRFVLLNVKMCLSTLLMKYKINASPDLQVPLGLTETRGILKANNVQVRLALR